MERLSSEYGWTPNQIREMDIKDVKDYLDILSIKNQLLKSKSK